MKLEDEFDSIRIHIKNLNEDQYIKFTNELDVLKNTIIEKDRDEFSDAIGNCVIILTKLAYLQGFKIENCINSSYNKLNHKL